jgi:hypothetical protein
MKVATQFVKWQVYPMPDGHFAVTNLKTTLRAKTEKIALRVARIKNRESAAGLLDNLRQKSKDISSKVSKLVE